MKKITKKLLQNGLFLIIMMSFSAPCVLAQGEDLGQPPDIAVPCVTKEKGFVVHFTAYQKADSSYQLPYKRFCHDLPATGLTLVTIDLMDQYTRNQAVALRIVKVAVGKNRGALKETRTLIELPEQHYTTGIIETKVNFTKRGLYAAILTLGGEEIIIPIQVGIKKESSTAQRIVVILFVILILAALGYVIYRYRFKGRSPKPVKTQEKEESQEDKEKQERQEDQEDKEDKN